MHTSLKSCLVGLALSLSLFSCIDHRLGGPQSPARLRLKKVEGGSLTADYTYDGLNRLATATKANGTLYFFSYDETNKITEVKQYENPADRTTGSAVLFPSSPDGRSFSATTYPIFMSMVDTVTSHLIIKRTGYSFDADKHLTRVYRQLGPANQNAFHVSTYSSTGENITRGEYNASPRANKGNTVFEYDDKINPFFESTDPNITNIDVLSRSFNLDDLLRFSRNNVVKFKMPEFPYTEVVYQYEYNAQGLPTKRTTVGTNEVVTYTYESY